MSCGGLHCAGCAGGMALPVVPIVELYGLTWVIEHLAEVVTVSAACGALAVAAVVALMRWCDRRQARAAIGRPYLYVREVPAVTASAERVPIADTARPAVAAPQVVFNFYGVPEADQAHVIRQALSGNPHGRADFIP
jgi:hypothetical protein